VWSEISFNIIQRAADELDGEVTGDV
jgi:hypothetical protein